MLTKVISKLDRAVLELAIVDAFYDMCFYESEEFIIDLEKYFESVDGKTNTEEQDTKFFESTMPYIEHSILIYGKSIMEGLKEGGKAGKPPANDSLKKIGMVPAETTKLILNKDSKAAYESEITEADETAIWEGVGSIIPDAAKRGFAKGKKALVNSVDKIGKSVKSGITVSAKLFSKNLKGFKIPSDKAAVTTPQKKM